MNKLPVILVLLICFGVKLAAQRTTASARPNIIFILTDDQRWDALGAAGNSIIHTPNLDQLAHKGILFKNAYVTTSICCVSRASLLSGQYESRHKINDFATDFTSQALNNTYPLLLKNAGYAIGFVGKYGIGNHHPSKYFDYWSCSEKGQPDYILIDKSGNKIHNTDSVGHDIEIFLNKFGYTRPFCLSVSFKAPHELDGDPPQFIPQQRFSNLYSNTTIPEPETADPKYWNSFPDFFRTDQNIARIRWKPLFSTPSAFQETVKNYYRLVTGVDDIVGKLMTQLKKLGIEKNTVIIFMGDNGFSLGEHGLEGKWYGYEESIRVPLIIYDPRLPEVNPNQIALNIDIAPTILSLAGIKIPQQMQGRNLLAKYPSERKDFFYEHTFLKSPQLPQEEGVVTKDFKYMNYIEHDYEELYKIQTDPHETTNLATDKRYASILKELRKRYLLLKGMVK
jgi:arylsulfatase A-like enzyme